MIIEFFSLEQIENVLRYHLITIVIIFSVFLTIIIQRAGTNKNRDIATKYINKLSPILHKTFKFYDEKLVQESANIIKIYPSGRWSCLFAIISFALVPRQQIISYLFNPFFFKLKDEIVIQIPVNNLHPLSITAAIVRKNQIKSITKTSFPDIKQLCKEYRPIEGKGEQKKLNVPSTHSILIQNKEHVELFLKTGEQVNIWKNHGKSVRLVYISDVNKFSRYPMAVRMVINANEDDVLPMFEWLMNFVDRIAEAKMGAKQRKQALKKRQNLEIKYQ